MQKRREFYCTCENINNNIHHRQTTVRLNLAKEWGKQQTLVRTVQRFKMFYLSSQYQYLPIKLLCVIDSLIFQMGACSHIYRGKHNRNIARIPYKYPQKFPHCSFGPVVKEHSLGSWVRQPAKKSFEILPVPLVNNAICPHEALFRKVNSLKYLRHSCSWHKLCSLRSDSVRQKL